VDLGKRVSGTGSDLCLGLLQLMRHALSDLSNICLDRGNLLVFHKCNLLDHLVYRFLGKFRTDLLGLVWRHGLVRVLATAVGPVAACTALVGAVFIRHVLPATVGAWAIVIRLMRRFVFCWEFNLGIELIKGDKRHYTTVAA
jgi:hypothetical protein